MSNSNLIAYYVKGAVPPSSGKPKRKTIKLQYPFTLEIEDQDGDCIIIEICRSKKSCITIGVGGDSGKRLAVLPRHATYLEVKLIDND